MSLSTQYILFAFNEIRYGQSQGAAGYATALQQREFFEDWALSEFVRTEAISP